MKFADVHFVEEVRAKRVLRAEGEVVRYDISYSVGDSNVLRGRAGLSRAQAYEFLTDLADLSGAAADAALLDADADLEGK